MPLINLQDVPYDCLPLPLFFSNRVVVLASAFADPSNPTAAEVTTFINTYFPNAAPGTLALYVANGTPSDPDYVWKLEDSTADMERVESPTTGDAPRAIIDVKRITNLQTGGEGSFSPGQTITNYSWTLSVNSIQIGAISGAAGVDASVESAIRYGTYDNPTWEYSFSEGDSVDICLTVTDNAGDVSAESCTSYVYTEVTY